jgi:adenylate cyclase
MARDELGFVYLTAAADSPDGYPRIGHVRLPEVAEQSGLRRGDLLIRAGNTDLRGAGPFSSHAMILAEARDHRVPVVYEREGAQMETVLDVSVRPPGRRYAMPFISVVSGLFGSLLLLRASRDPRSFPLFIWYFAYAVQHAPFQGQNLLLTYVSMSLYYLSHFLILPLALLSVLKWRDRPAPKLVRAGTWLFGAAGPARAAQYNGAVLPSEVGLQIFSFTNAIACVLFVGIFVLVMIRAERVVRRQLSWILFGMFVGITPVVFLDIALVFEPRFFAWRELASVTITAVPIAFFIAIVRYDLLDIHRVMSATAAYTLLGIVLLGGLLAVVPRIAEAANDAMGVSADAAQVLLSVGLAAILVPGYRVVQPQMDRIFFRERRAIQHGIDRLLYDLAACNDAAAVTELVGTRLDTLLQPDVCAVYVRSGEVYAPVFTRGSAVPPALAAGGALIGALDDARAPVNVERWRRRRSAIQLGPADRAFVETLGARVLVPVHYRGALALFVCLGTKRSGDIYTPTELAQLGRVADRVAAELARLEDAEVIRQGREMQESLRRYVPGAIAEHLTIGQSLEAGEREVTVLFVDIRGYTSLSEGMKADDSSTVNRYTDTVSRVVRAHGGSVVEFNGDGMMVVFGAPAELESKERSAVAAGQEIVAAVAALEPAAPVEGRERLSCGVGIATGPAFVGNIQAVDRMIWSAIGNTTNLAARLEGLTRDLDASVVIDAATWKCLDRDRDAFAKQAGTRIRGRGDPQDIYSLPLTNASFAT